MKRFLSVFLVLVIALIGAISLIAPPITIAQTADQATLIGVQSADQITSAGIQNATLTTDQKNASLINLLNASVINTNKTLVGFSLLTHPGAANLTENTFIGYTSPPAFSSQATILSAITTEWPPYGALTSACYDVDIGASLGAVPFNFVEMTDQAGAVPPLLSAEAKDNNYLGATATNDGTITLTLDDGTASPGEAYAMMTIPTITDDTANMSTDIALTGENSIYSEAITAGAAYNYRC